MNEVKGVVVTNEKYLHFFLRNDMFRQFIQSVANLHDMLLCSIGPAENMVSTENGWMGIRCGTSVQDIPC